MQVANPDDPKESKKNRETLRRDRPDHLKNLDKETRRLARDERRRREDERQTNSTQRDRNDSTEKEEKQTTDGDSNTDDQKDTSGSNRQSLEAKSSDDPEITNYVPVKKVSISEEPQHEVISDRRPSNSSQNRTQDQEDLQDDGSSSSGSSGSSPSPPSSRSNSLGSRKSSTESHIPLSSPSGSFVAQDSEFGDWYMNTEQTILENIDAQESLSSIRARWLEMEKETEERVRSNTTVSKGAFIKPTTEDQKDFQIGKGTIIADIKKTLLDQVKEKDKDYEEEQPAMRGTVFQFLQQKQKLVREEQAEQAREEERKARLVLPPPPPIPIEELSVTPPKSHLTHSASMSTLPSLPLPEVKTVGSASPSMSRSALKKELEREKEREKKEKERERKEKKQQEKLLKKESKDKKKVASIERPRSAEGMYPNSSSSFSALPSTSSLSPSPSQSPIPVHTMSLPKGPYALYEYEADDDRMISVPKLGAIKIIDKDFSKDWAKIEFNGRSGFFPMLFIKIPKVEPKGFLEFAEGDEQEEEPAKNRPLSLQEGGDAAIATFRRVSAAEDEDESDPRVLEFEAKDSEANIVLSNDDPNSPNQVRGATLYKLVQRVTYEKYPDVEFVGSFLLTYTAFIQLSELLELLIIRYKTPRPANMDVETFKRTKQMPIRLRVINFMKSWIKKDYGIIKDKGLIPKIREFLNVTMNISMPSTAKDILALLSSKEEEIPTDTERIVSKKPPKPYLPRRFTDLTLQDLHPEEVARQITLIENELFRAIQPHECLKQKWLKESKSLTPGIHKMITRFNQVSMWVANEIIQLEDVKLRAVTLNRFIFVAQKCFELNNFNAVMEILSALNMSSVHRLRQTWALLPPKSLEIFDSLVNLMSPEGNFAAYRDTMKRSRPPIVPYLGLILTDLVFISEGNPDYLSDHPNLINWWKLNLLASTIKDMQQYQDTPYNLEKLDFLQNYLLSQKQNTTEEELYQLSIIREERVARPRKKIAAE